MIYYIVNARMPTEKAHGIQIMQMCQAFANCGHKLELVVPRRLNSIKKDPFDFYGIERVFKIRKLPCLDLIPLDKFLGSLALWLTTFSFLLVVAIGLFFKKKDVVFTRDKFLLPLSLVGAKVFYEIHDFPAAFSLFYKICLPRLAGVVVTNNWKKQELIKRFKVPENKILVAFNGVDVEKFNISCSKQEAREKLNLSQDKKIILYTGHLYRWKGSTNLLQAARMMTDEQLSFVFVGGTAEDIKNFRAWAVELKLNNVSVIGHREHSEIPYWLKAADVLILPNTAKKDISKYWTVPLKMFEYMASKRPIVASDLPSLREVLNDKNALLVEPDDIQALSQGIEKVLQNQELAVNISSQAFADVQNYTWQKRAERILNFIKHR